jgi:hypothetical protein
MSFDLNLNTVCDHRIDKEAVTLDTDRRSIRASKPIAASNVGVFASSTQLAKSLYSLVFDSAQNVPVNQNRKVYLAFKWRSTEDFFELSYNTLSGYCPKCVGFNQINDVSYSAEGDFYTLINEPLLLQNLEKFTVTELQSNPFQLFIGTNLVKLLGQRVSDSSYMATKITQEINTTLQTLKGLQDNLRFANRAVTDGELLDTINSIKVNFDTVDPSIVRAFIVAQAKSGKTVTFTQFLKIA